MRNELKKIQKILNSDHPERSETQREDEEVLDIEEEEQRKRSREAFLKITLHFLRGMKQTELAERLQSSKEISLKFKHGIEKGNLIMLQEDDKIKVSFFGEVDVVTDSYCVFIQDTLFRFLFNVISKLT